MIDCPNCNGEVAWNQILGIWSHLEENRTTALCPLFKKVAS